MQRRAFKIITGGIVRTPTNNLYNEIGMETLKVRRERNVLLFFFKIIHNMVPSYLQELKPDKKKSGRYTFRTKNDFVEPDWRITKYRKSFLPFAISLWNRLDENTRKITNYESFKDTLMTNTIDNPLFYVGSRQEQIIMAKLRMGGSNLKDNCAQIEKECLAIVHAMTRWDQWLYGHHHIVVESDHKPLETIFKHPISHAPKRLQKMMLRLQRYTFTIVYRKGSTMWLADTLSRAPLPREHAQVDSFEVFVTENIQTTSKPKTNNRPHTLCNPTRDTGRSNIVTYHTIHPTRMA